MSLRVHDHVLASGEGTGDLVIPNAVGGSAILSIGSRAFASNKSLTGVTLPQGVTQIGDYAFAYCENLKSVKLPKSLNAIWNGAFADCRSLTNIVLPEGLAEIGAGAFSGCSSLCRIVIPKSVTKVGYRAFKDCTSLREIVVSGNADMETDILAGCTALESADFPPPAEYRKLPSVHAPDTLKRVSVGAGHVYNNRWWREWLRNLCILNPYLRELILPEDAAVDGAVVPPNCRIIRR